MTDFIDWLYATPLSTGIRDVTWIIPAVQSVHILALSVLFGSAMLVQLRIIGFMAKDEQVGTVARRHLPWIGRSLIVLLLTGLVMVLGEPDRTVPNMLFWIKMGLVALGALALWLAFSPLMRVDGDSAPARMPVIAAVLGIPVLLAIIACGRWIAYY